MAVSSSLTIPLISRSRRYVEFCEHEPAEMHFVSNWFGTRGRACQKIREDGATAERQLCCMTFATP